MKILKISISNLNSIENAEIDFCDETLSKEPLFLICGETGSGKTTILDAITLALYDKASRFETTDNKEKTSDGQAANSATHILRRGTKDGFAKVRFKVQNEVYQATWQMHKTRNGTFDIASRRKLEAIRNDSYEECAVKVGEVNEKIVGLIGLTYDQFMRSVMLAQNHFSTFLTSDKAKQTEILEMLTGTEIYSDIADHVRVRKNAAYAEQKNLSSKFEEVSASLKSEEEINRLVQEKLKNEALQKLKDADLSIFEKQLVWLSEEMRLKKSFEAASKALQDATAQQKSEEFAKKRSLLTDYQDTEEIRKVLSEKARLESENSDIEKAIQTSKLTFANLSASRKKMLDHLHMLQSNKICLEAYVNENKSHEVMFLKTEIIAKNLKDASDAEAKIQQYQKDSQESFKRKDELQKEVDKLSFEHQRLSEEKESADKNLAARQAEFQSTKYEELTAQRDALDIDLKRYSKHHQKLELIKKEMEHYWLNESLAASYRAEIQKDENELIALQQSRLEAQKSYDAKNAAYQKQRLVVDDVAKEFRSKLVDGEPCPICGSLHHSVQAEEVLDSLLQFFEKERSESEAKLNGAKDAENNCIAGIEAKKHSSKRKIKIWTKSRIMSLNYANKRFCRLKKFLTKS
jgi:ATPase involved in DNA repair